MALPADVLRAAAEPSPAAAQPLANRAMISLPAQRRVVERHGGVRGVPDPQSVAATLSSVWKGGRQGSVPRRAADAAGHRGHDRRQSADGERTSCPHEGAWPDPDGRAQDVCARRGLEGDLSGPATHGYERPVHLTVEHWTRLAWPSSIWVAGEGGFAAVAVSDGRTLNSRFRPHCGHPTVNGRSGWMAGFKGTADIAREPARYGRPNVCLSRAPTELPTLSRPSRRRSQGLKPKSPRPFSKYRRGLSPG